MPLQPSFFDNVYPVQTTITHESGEVECLPVYFDAWVSVSQFERDTYTYPSLFVFWWDEEHQVYQRLIVHPEAGDTM